MDYMHKYTENPFEDLYWNLGEQRKETINIIGGNSQNFRTSEKVSGFIAEKYKVDVKVVLPDALKGKLPPLPNIIYMPSTDSGSFDDTDSFKELITAADYNLLIGEFSKNSITEKAICEVCDSKGKIVIARDGVDLLAGFKPEKSLMNENLIMFSSVPQLQKLLRAVYYPKVLLLTQSLMQVSEILHKFTLSYPVTIVTLHGEQVLVAHAGNLHVLPLEKTGYTPITFWNGELAAKIAVMNIFNPDNVLNATTAALFS